MAGSTGPTPFCGVLSGLHALQKRAGKKGICIWLRCVGGGRLFQTTSGGAGAPYDDRSPCVGSTFGMEWRQESALWYERGFEGRVPLGRGTAREKYLCHICTSQLALHESFFDRDPTSAAIYQVTAGDCRAARCMIRQTHPFINYTHTTLAFCAINKK